MKKSPILFSLLLLIISCSGQDKSSLNNYSQRKEYGYTNSVKEVITYICKAKNEQIPIDTVNFIGKYTKYFDKSGNSVEDNNSLNIGDSSIQKVKRIYNGTGKNISLSEVTIHNDHTETRALKYGWLDDFSYKIVDLNDEQYDVTIILNKDYSISKSLMKLNDKQFAESIQNILQNKRIKKTIKKTITKSEHNIITENYRIEVIKEYDKFGNPTLIYSYEDKDEKQISDVLFKVYKYF